MNLNSGSDVNKEVIGAGLLRLMWAYLFIYLFIYMILCYNTPIIDRCRKIDLIMIIS